MTFIDTCKVQGLLNFADKLHPVRRGYVAVDKQGTGALPRISRKSKTATIGQSSALVAPKAIVVPQQS